ncbi:septation protein SepH [Phytoactinopolyspora halotolerans]|uniref:DUF3071 domain-containing protein n=1 Tax=Phytoactinopolyspora halotolerans TaxID=1981512 RepID=A0A6L9SGK1_9ACTN|nr:septation protein SepH [Phytoactinopolyspora halotolerans]NEE04269.1 DUF3071 domain-containing protein [Phytoactinopolyspora halotolerans]
MRELRLTAVSEDGAYLILSDGDQQFALRADERLHAAIRGDRARLGQLEIQLESQLRPRDIQARIRAGESVESVAAAATMPLEKVRRFAGPVLAEREHIAERARQAHLKRLAGEGPVRTLESAAADYVASIGGQPDTIVWDAWRADDGRWRVGCSWASPDESDDSADTAAPADETSALFSFDPSGRSAVPQDATARLVAGEPRPEPEPAPEPELEQLPDEYETPAGPPRLSVVSQPEEDHLEPDDEEPGDDVQQPPAAAHPLGLGEPQRPEPVPRLVRSADEQDDDSDDDPTEQTTPIEPAARRPRRAGRYGRPERRRRDAELWTDEPDAADDDDTATDRLRLSDIASHVEVEGDEDTQDLAPTAQDLAPTAQEPPPPAKPRGSSRSRRPSVPSWDEIMFGRRKND